MNWTLDTLSICERSRRLRADVLVAGTLLFRTADMTTAIRDLWALLNRQQAPMKR